VLLQSEGGMTEAALVVRDLRETHGVFCSIVVYPVVPKGVIMLRVIPTSAHSLADVDYTLNVFSEVAENLKNGVYRQVTTPPTLEERVELSAESAAE